MQDVPLETMDLRQLFLGNFLVTLLMCMADCPHAHMVQTSTQDEEQRHERIQPQMFQLTEETLHENLIVTQDDTN